MSGLPQFDSDGFAVDAPSKGSSGGVGDIFSRAAAAVKSMTVDRARELADQSMSLVAPWLSNITWTISQAYITLARSAYNANPVVFSVARFLAASVAEPPIVPSDVDESYNKTELNFSHPFYKLLRNPNELMTTHDFVNLIVIHASIAGKSYWWKERDRLGRVRALWPLRPDRVGPLYNVQPVQGYQFGMTGPNEPIEATNRLLAGWNYWPPGTTKAIRIPASDVMAIICPNPAGESGGVVEGIGWIQVLAREIEADNEATSFVAALLKNWAMPGAILHVKAALQKDRIARFKREFKRTFGGDRRGDIAVFDGDTMFQQVGFNMQELEFPTIRKVSESRVSSAAGVPVPLIGFVLGTESASRSTLAEYRELFAETTLPDWWKRIQEAISRDVAPEFGKNLICEFDTSKVKALTLQSNRQIQPFQIAFQSGAITIDEARMNILGLDPLPDGRGNVLLIPNLVTPIPADAADSSLWDNLLNQGTGLNAEEQQKLSQEHDNDPRTNAANVTRPARGKPTTSQNTTAGTGGKRAIPLDMTPEGRKIIRITEARKHLGARGKPWVPPMEWRAPVYEYEDAAPKRLADIDTSLLDELAV